MRFEEHRIQWVIAGRCMNRSDPAGCCVRGSTHHPSQFPRSVPTAWARAVVLMPLHLLLHSPASSGGWVWWV